MEILLHVVEIGLLVAVVGKLYWPTQVSAAQLPPTNYLEPGASHVPHVPHVATHSQIRKYLDAKAVRVERRRRQ